MSRHHRILSAALCAALLAAVTSPAGAKPKPHKKPHVAPKPALALTPGTYSGTIEMGVQAYVGNTYAATLTGTWTLSVDAKDHATGTETMQAPIPFEPGSGCSTSPPSWTLAFTAKLGQDILAQGTPGSVQGNALSISLSNIQSGGWMGTPDTYTLTCGPYTFSKMIIVQMLGEPSVAIETSAKLPLALFKTPGKPFTVQISNIENAPFTQTYTLRTGPKA